MTEQEKNELKDAVIAELKSEGTDVSQATVVTDANGVSYVICYDTNGNISRITPSVLNGGLSEDIKQEIVRATNVEQALIDEIARTNDAVNYVKGVAARYDGSNFSSTANEVRLKTTSIDTENSQTIVLPSATTETAGVMSAEDKTNVNKIPSSVNGAYFKQWASAVDLNINKNDGSTVKHTIPAATEEKAGVMTAADKAKLDAELPVTSYAIPSDLNFNDYTDEGVYNLTTAQDTINSPVISNGQLRARLTVLRTSDGNIVITQVLNLNNNAGGEGNVYIRSCQNGEWKPWGKLQTNIEVGAIGLGQSKTFDDLTDNGIYSGVNVIQVGTDSSGYPITSYETFVLVVINAYLTGGGISQLKYSLLLDGTTSVTTRTYTTTWSDWSKLTGDGSVEPATVTSYGTVRLGTEDRSITHPDLKIGSVVAPVTMFTRGDGISGLGVLLGSGLGPDGAKAFIKLGTDNRFLGFDNEGGLIVNISLGTEADQFNLIPLCFGSATEDLPSSFSQEFLGIPVDPNSFTFATGKLQHKATDITSKLKEIDGIGGDAILNLFADGSIQLGNEYMILGQYENLENVLSKLDYYQKIKEHIASKMLAAYDFIYLFLRVLQYDAAGCSWVVDTYIASCGTPQHFTYTVYESPTESTYNVYVSEYNMTLL